MTARFAGQLFCSEEGNQAAAKLTFGFIRAYNEKIRSSGAAALRSSGIFESVRGIERMCAFDNSTGNTELSG